MLHGGLAVAPRFRIALYSTPERGNRSTRYPEKPDLFLAVGKALLLILSQLVSNRCKFRASDDTLSNH